MSFTRPEPDPIVIYSVADVRRILRVSSKNAYDLVKKIGRRIGRRLIVAKPTLERWLAGADDVEEKAPRARRRRAAK